VMMMMDRLDENKCGRAGRAMRTLTAHITGMEKGTHSSIVTRLYNRDVVQSIHLMAIL
jgi:hypothetical protein